MIEKKKRNELLTGWFKVNQEVLINARDLVDELQTKDDLKREVERLGLIIARLQNRVEGFKLDKLIYDLNKPYYERFDIKG